MTESKPKYDVKDGDKLAELIAEFDTLMADFSSCSERGRELLLELSEEIKKREKPKTDRACLMCEVGRMEEKSGSNGYGWYCSLCDVFEPWEQD